MKLLRFILTLSHLIILILSAGTLLNDFFPPSRFKYLNLLSLLFPALMIINVILCFFWIITGQKRAFLFIILTMLFYKPIGRWININSKSTEKGNLKIVSMNIKSGEMGRDEIYEYLKNTDADIIFGQEYGKEFNVPNYPHRTEEYEIVALNSKTEIIRTQKVATTGNGNAFYADISFKGKIIRVINLYLNPFAFDKTKVKPGQNLETNQHKLKYIVRTLVPTFQIHEQEVRDIRRAIDESPYPTILVGDFNAVPNSYEYYEMGRGLTDAFVAVGRGSATSFHDYKFPIRIDYIFTSKEIKAVNYRVDRSVKLSDHYPIVAEFKIE